MSNRWQELIAFLASCAFIYFLFDPKNPSFHPIKWTEIRPYVGPGVLIVAGGQVWRRYQLQFQRYQIGIMFCWVGFFNGLLAMVSRRVWIAMFVLGILIVGIQFLVNTYTSKKMKLSH